MATGPKQIQNMYGDLERACTSKGLRVEPEKLQLWSNFPGNRVRAGGHDLKVEASMVFLGALLSLGGSYRRGRGPVRIGMDQVLGHQASAYPSLLEPMQRL